MSTTTIKSSDVDAVNAMVDSLSSKLYRLERIVHLAAFATEARRVLTGIDEIAMASPDFRTTVMDGIDAPFDWHEYSDEGAVVMREVAGEISDVANELFKGTSGFRILSNERYSSTGELIKGVTA